MIRLIPKLIVLMVFFFLISGLSAYFTLSYFIQNEETVIVPDLTGKDIVSVLEILTRLGLNTKIKNSAYSQAVAKNNIISQEPKPGEKIKKDRDVQIILSKGTKTLFMPDLKSLDLQQARLILDKNGIIQGNIAKTHHADILMNRIIAQYPLSGDTVPRGITADLLVSTGPRPREIFMPDLRGLFLDEAVLRAEKNHLLIDQIKTVYQKDLAENIILNQHPLPGYHVLEKHFINLEINRKAGQDQAHPHTGMHLNTLFRYRLPPGFLKQHIRLELRMFGMTIVLYDELIAPEKEIWVMVPAYSLAIVFLYKNEDLIDTQIYDK